MSIHPQIIEKEGKKEFLVLPYEEFLFLQEALENYEDLRTLRSEKAATASVIDGNVIIRMDSGVEIRFPVARNPRLAKGSGSQLNNVEISPFGIH